MFRVLGLSNPEEKYRETPHNIGGSILGLVLDRMTGFSGQYFNKKRNSSLSRGVVCGSDVEFIFSENYMNQSGRCFSGLAKEDIDPAKVVVLYDDIDLPFGEVRVSVNRGDGGHNGIKDIAKVLGTKNFIRIRVGVCPLDFFGKCRKPKGAAVTKYLVDRKLGKRQLCKYDEIAEKTESVLESIIADGASEAMNKFN